MSRWRQLCRDISSIAQALNRIAILMEVRDAREDFARQRYVQTGYSTSADIHHRRDS